VPTSDPTHPATPGAQSPENPLKSLMDFATFESFISEKGGSPNMKAIKVGNIIEYSQPGLGRTSTGQVVELGKNYVVIDKVRFNLTQGGVCKQLSVFKQGKIVFTATSAIYSFD
jgi:uncharacterized protein YkvS